MRALIEDVRRWASEKGWAVHEGERDLPEQALGTYRVPALEIEMPTGRVLLEPRGRDVAGAEGRVDLSAWPTYYRVMLLHKPDQGWLVRTDSGLIWPHPWGETTFVELAEGLLGAS